jgi:hypothetical protein
LRNAWGWLVGGLGFVGWHWRAEVGGVGITHFHFLSLNNKIRIVISEARQRPPSPPSSPDRQTDRQTLPSPLVDA